MGHQLQKDHPVLYPEPALEPGVGTCARAQRPDGDRRLVSDDATGVWHFCWDRNVLGPPPKEAKNRHVLVFPVSLF